MGSQNWNQVLDISSHQPTLAGVSTGLNVVAALGLAIELGTGKRIVIPGCGNGIKYLDSDIYS